MALVKMLIQVSGGRGGVDWPAPGQTIDLPELEVADLERNGIVAVVGEVPNDHQGAQITSAMVDTTPRRRKA